MEYTVCISQIRYLLQGCCYTCFCQVVPITINQIIPSAYCNIIEKIVFLLDHVNCIFCQIPAIAYLLVIAFFARSQLHNTNKSLIHRIKFILLDPTTCIFTRSQHIILLHLFFLLCCVYQKHFLSLLGYSSFFPFCQIVA